MAQLQAVPHQRKISQITNRKNMPKKQERAAEAAPSIFPLTNMQSQSEISKCCAKKSRAKLSSSLSSPKQNTQPPTKSDGDKTDARTLEVVQNLAKRALLWWHEIIEAATARHIPPTKCLVKLLYAQNAQNGGAPE